mgnify:CR=1 FL=1
MVIYKTTTRFFLSCIYKEAKALFPFAYLQREIRIIRSNVSDDHRIPAVTGKCIFVRRTVIFDKADLSAICCLDHEGTHGIAGGDAFIGRDGPFLLLREGTNVGDFFRDHQKDPSYRRWQSGCSFQSLFLHHEYQKEQSYTLFRRQPVR